MKEKEIIEQIRRRDEAGLAAFLQHYSALLRYVVKPIVPGTQDQEECVSEIAMRVWEKIESYDPARGKWTTWLTALARNVARNKVRGGQVVQTTDGIPEELPAIELTPEEIVIQKERWAAIERAIKQLSAADRYLFYRKYYYMQPIAQIAAELGTTERAVEGRLYRLKKQLRKQLGGDRHA